MKIFRILVALLLTTSLLTACGTAEAPPEWRMATQDEQSALRIAHDGESSQMFSPILPGWQPLQIAKKEKRFTTDSGITALRGTVVFSVCLEGDVQEACASPDSQRPESPAIYMEYVRDTKNNRYRIYDIVALVAYIGGEGLACTPADVFVLDESSAQLLQHVFDTFAEGDGPPMHGSLAVDFGRQGEIYWQCGELNTDNFLPQPNL